MEIGVLSLQGAFLEHIQMLNKVGVASKEIRQKNDFSRKIDGIILPGGESSVIGKLLNDLDLLQPIKEAIIDGMPVFGTCAGLILLAKEIEGQNTTHIGTMNITVKRNAYGRQLGSFVIKSNFCTNHTNHTTNNHKSNKENNLSSEIQMPFIRGPYITAVGDNVKILSVVNGNIVAAQEKNQLVTSFHPELTNDLTVINYFLQMI